MSNLTHYVDFRAATDVDDEFGSEVFIRALFSTLHRARAELKHDFPLDFPECINGSNSPQAAGNLVRVLLVTITYGCFASLALWKWRRRSLS